jgi:hypothetical protein
MNGYNMKQEQLSLDTKIALELSVLLEKGSDGSVLNVNPSSDLLLLLELYIPQLLSLKYPKWREESLDGFLLTKAQKIASGIAEFAGLCILISDQTVTPFFTRLTLDSPHDSILSYQVFLGESGGGHLGISGPPCNSPRAEKLLQTLSARLDTIHWLYTTTKNEM